jgi:hypothetical protein
MSLVGVFPQVCCDQAHPIPKNRFLKVVNPSFTFNLPCSSYQSMAVPIAGVPIVPILWGDLVDALVEVVLPGVVIRSKLELHVHTSIACGYLAFSRGEGLNEDTWHWSRKYEWSWVFCR